MHLFSWRGSSKDCATTGWCDPGNGIDTIAPPGAADRGRVDNMEEPAGGRSSAHLRPDSGTRGVGGNSCRSFTKVANASLGVEAKAISLSSVGCHRLASALALSWGPGTDWECFEPWSSSTPKTDLLHPDLPLASLAELAISTKGPVLTVRV